MIYQLKLKYKIGVICIYTFCALTPTWVYVIRGIRPTGILYFCLQLFLLLGLAFVIQWVLKTKITVQENDHE